MEMVRELGHGVKLLRKLELSRQPMSALGLEICSEKESAPPSLGAL
jgi:hypothetical protein